MNNFKNLRDCDSVNDEEKILAIIQEAGNEVYNTLKKVDQRLHQFLEFSEMGFLELNKFLQFKPQREKHELEKLKLSKYVKSLDILDG